MGKPESKCDAEVHKTFPILKRVEIIYIVNAGELITIYIANALSATWDGTSQHGAFYAPF